jgi:hypothetical protein
MYVEHGGGFLGCRDRGRFGGVRCRRRAGVALGHELSWKGLRGEWRIGAGGGVTGMGVSFAMGVPWGY